MSRSGAVILALRGYLADCADLQHGVAFEHWTRVPMGEPRGMAWQRIFHAAPQRSARPGAGPALPTDALATEYFRTALVLELSAGRSESGGPSAGGSGTHPPLFASPAAAAFSQARD